MNQNFDSKELLKYSKKGELFRAGLAEEIVISQIDTFEAKIIDETFEFKLKNSHDYYYVDNIPQKLILRKLNDNIKRIYKDEQANRKFIIQQVKTLLNEDVPFWVIKTDIKSFYESIDKHKIFKKLKNDAMLSYYSISLIKKIFENPEISLSTGLPRGMSISSTLSELYMRRFDKWVQRYTHVYYYARFVDDIVIFLSNRDSAIGLYSQLNNKLLELCNLRINEEKTELIDGKTFKIIKKGYRKAPNHNKIEYLGYLFYLDENNSDRLSNLKISIADKKVKKIKSRIVYSYVDFLKNNDFELLKSRIKFLTGNYGISRSNDGGVLKAGIFFNYTHLTNFNILAELNVFHRKILFSKRGTLGVRLYAVLTPVQREYLKKHCFIEGHRKKTYDSFSYAEMGQIIKCW